MRVFLSLAVAAVVSGGCNPSPGPGGGPVKPQAGYTFEVRGKGGAFTKGQAATFSVQAGANAGAIKDGKLTVNGKSYGAVPDGATILVEEDGKVLVNGRERAPE